MCCFVDDEKNCYLHLATGLSVTDNGMERWALGKGITQKNEA